MSEHVLFIHSTATSPLLWANVPQEVIGNRNALRPANLGYAPNPPLARGTKVTLDDEAAHLLRQLPEDGARVHLVAHSYGATVALTLADRPELRGRLASMFLAEPVLFGALIADVDGEVGKRDPEAVASAADRFARDAAFLDPERAGSSEWIGEFIDYWNRPGSWAKMPEPLKDETRLVGWKIFQEVMMCRGADRPFKDWRMAVPTTLVFGERTTPHSRAMTLALERTHPDADLAVVEMKGTGHMAPLTHPDIVKGELARHFARVSADRVTR